TPSPTPSPTPSITPSPIPGPPDNNNPGGGPGDEYMKNDLIISEFISNPEGVDGETNEFIEIYNPSDFNVDLSGWKLTNKKGHFYEFLDHIIIEPKQYFSIFRRDFDFTLYNENGKVSLFDPAGSLIYSLSFTEKAPSGNSYNINVKNFNDRGYWSKTPTPGQVNSAKKEDQTEDLKDPKNEEKTSQKDQKQDPDQACQTIKEIEKINNLNNKTCVNLKGLIISDKNFLSDDFSYYLELEKGGVQITFSEDFDIKKGDLLELNGEFRITKQRNYVKIENFEDFDKLGFKDVTYQDLSKIDKNEYKKITGSAVKFSGVLEKRHFNVYYFHAPAKDDLNFKTYIKKEGVEGLEDLEVLAQYQIYGILEADRVLVSKIEKQRDAKEKSKQEEPDQGGSQNTDLENKNNEILQKTTDQKDLITEKMEIKTNDLLQKPGDNLQNFLIIDNLSTEPTGKNQLKEKLALVLRSFLE
ncbi:MAG: hypothetical protein GF335_02860, partial [Candidatus Moranbacteria bacterium]|nr:hypothetical protein [Candidatus Moranbacteria bacterium]